MRITPEDWKDLFALRDDLQDEDRALLRRAIKYIEYLEITMRQARKLLHIQGKGDQ
jgi:hypothetical protein